MNAPAYFLPALICCAISIYGEPLKSLSYNLIEGLPNIHINPESETIGHTWSKGSIWEKHLIQKFYALLPHDKPFVAFDLGAQTGAFSLMAKYFPLSTWHAFEPIAEAATLLECNLALNDIHNVTVHRVAVTNFCGTTILSMPNRANWGLSTIGPNALRFKPQSHREVACIDLDTFITLHNIERVDFMKLDTEGSELFILQGARNMIARDHPVMIMEYKELNMQQCNILKKDLDDFLVHMGYKWKLVSTEDILCTPIHP